MWFSGVIWVLGGCDIGCWLFRLFLCCFYWCIWYFVVVDVVDCVLCDCDELFVIVVDDEYMVLVGCLVLVSVDEFCVGDECVVYGWL